MAFIHKTGDWNRATRALRRSRYLQVIANAPRTVLVRAAAVLQREMKVGLNSNRLTLAPLAQRTQIEKRALGYKWKTPLVRTGELIRSISIVKRPDYIFVGVPRNSGKYSYGGNLQVMDAAYINHEGLGKNLPARPFMTNAYKNVDKKVVDLVVKQAKHALLSGI